MIFLCAGHHAEKPGAVCPPLVEHIEAMLWVDLIYSHLPSDVVVKVPPRTLKEKVELINSNAATCAIELHFNSAKDTNGSHVGRGGEVLYYPRSRKGFELAEQIELYIKNICTPWRGCKEGWYHMNQNNGPDFFLAKTKCPAVIVEPEFIQHADNIDSIREQCCLSIAEALLDYVGGL